MSNLHLYKGFFYATQHAILMHSDIWLLLSGGIKVTQQFLLFNCFKYF